VQQLDPAGNALGGLIQPAGVDQDARQRGYQPLRALGLGDEPTIPHSSVVSGAAGAGPYRRRGVSETLPRRRHTRARMVIGAGQ
jgi:hypothetical protein